MDWHQELEIRTAVVVDYPKASIAKIEGAPHGEIKK